MSGERLDPRIGQDGGKAPKVCAVSGQSVRGKHQEQRALRDGYYYAVLVKYKGREPEGLHTELLALLPPPEPVIEAVSGDVAEVLSDEAAASLPDAVVEELPFAVEAAPENESPAPSRRKKGTD